MPGVLLLVPVLVSVRVVPESDWLGQGCRLHAGVRDVPADGVLVGFDQTKLEMVHQLGGKAGTRLGSRRPGPRSTRRKQLYWKCNCYGKQSDIKTCFQFRANNEIKLFYT
jgi:hypothetical protein